MLQFALRAAAVIDCLLHVWVFNLARRDEVFFFGLVFGINSLNKAVKSFLVNIARGQLLYDKSCFDSGQFNSACLIYDNII